MPWQHVYVNEKLREFQNLQLKSRRLPPEPPRRSKLVIGPLARGAGRALRRFGEGLESWGAAHPQREPSGRPHLR